MVRCALMYRLTNPMSLILRPMHRVYPDWNGEDDYAVFSGEMQLGRILRTTQSGSTPVPWQWTITGVHMVPSGLASNGRTATLDEAKSEFAAQWGKYLRAIP